MSLLVDTRVVDLRVEHALVPVKFVFRTVLVGTYRWSFEGEVLWHGQREVKGATLVRTIGLYAE